LAERFGLLGAVRRLVTALKQSQPG
jgi:hypothetical protein